MVRLVASAALLAAIQGTAGADPDTRQLSPLRRQREDAQRLAAQQRSLARDPAAPAPPAAPVARPAPDLQLTVPPRRTRLRFAGLTLIGVAAASGVFTLTMYAADSAAPDPSFELYGDVKPVFAVATVVTGAIGLVLLQSSRTIQVAPAVSSRAVGIAITARL